MQVSKRKRYDIALMYMKPVIPWINDILIAGANIIGVIVGSSLAGMFLFICCPIAIVISIICCVVCAVGQSSRNVNRNVHVSGTRPTTTHTTATTFIAPSHPTTEAYPHQPSASAPSHAPDPVYPPAEQYPPVAYPTDPTLTSQSPPPYPGKAPYPAYWKQL